MKESMDMDSEPKTRQPHLEEMADIPEAIGDMDFFDDVSAPAIDDDHSHHNHEELMPIPRHSTDPVLIVDEFDHDGAPALEGDADSLDIESLTADIDRVFRIEEKKEFSDDIAIAAAGETRDAPVTPTIRSDVQADHPQKPSTDKKQKKTDSRNKITIEIPRELRENLPGTFKIKNVNPINLHEAEAVANEGILLLTEDDLIMELEESELVPVEAAPAIADGDELLTEEEVAVEEPDETADESGDHTEPYDDFVLEEVMKPGDEELSEEQPIERTAVGDEMEHGVFIAEDDNQTYIIPDAEGETGAHEPEFIILEDDAPRADEKPAIIPDASEPREIAATASADDVIVLSPFEEAAFESMPGPELAPPPVEERIAPADGMIKRGVLYETRDEIFLDLDQLAEGPEAPGIPHAMRAPESVDRGVDANIQGHDRNKIDALLIEESEDAIGAPVTERVSAAPAYGPAFQSTGEAFDDNVLIIDNFTDPKIQRPAWSFTENGIAALISRRFAGKKPHTRVIAGADSEIDRLSIAPFAADTEPPVAKTTSGEIIYLSEGGSGLIDDVKKSIEEELAAPTAFIFEEDISSIQQKLEEIKTRKAQAAPQQISDRVVVIENTDNVNTFLESLPANKQENIRRLLHYMDGLFESLPADVVENFAQSEYFNLYQEVLNDLGL